MNRYIDSEIILTRKIKYIVYVYVMIIIIMLLSYYQIREIDSEYFTDNITTYQIVTINLDMPNKYKYNNLTLDLKLIKENKKIIDYLLRK